MHIIAVNTTVPTKAVRFIVYLFHSFIIVTKSSKR
jgi:hypothetical protein